MTTIAAALDATYVAYWESTLGTADAIAQVQAAASCYTEWGALDLLLANALPSEQLTAAAGRGDEISRRLLAATPEDVMTDREDPRAAWGMTDTDLVAENAALRKQLADLKAEVDSDAHLGKVVQERDKALAELATMTYVAQKNKEHVAESIRYAEELEQQQDKSRAELAAVRAKAQRLAELAEQARAAFEQETGAAASECARITASFAVGLRAVAAADVLAEGGERQ